MKEELTTRKSAASALFFWAYFIYYAGYCVFSSFIVMYLTEQGYSATLCGLITSLTMGANLLMEPVGGYITDTLLPTRSYLMLCVGGVTILCIFCTLTAQNPLPCVAALILCAGLAYPFSQLMDAWVECCRKEEPTLVYSRIRAGGSIGFALTSILAGYYFRAMGWNSYFLVQAALFLLLLPLLWHLPAIPLGNVRKGQQKRAGEEWLSPAAAFRVALGNRRYLLFLLLCTTYWFSHRPVGSYLSLLVNARAGDASTFGNVCGIGAAVEFLVLLWLGKRQKGKSCPVRLLLGIALLTGLLRPACIALFSGVWPLYLGQIAQSVSFACYLSSCVPGFAALTDGRIRSFSISMGLTVSSVAGTVGANLLGGFLCDRLGTMALLGLSGGIALANCVLFLLCNRFVFVGNTADRAA